MRVTRTVPFCQSPMHSAGNLHRAASPVLSITIDNVRYCTAYTNTYPAEPSGESVWGRSQQESKTAMYPRPCGWHMDPEKQCTCSPTVVARYQKRMSGPLLDRID